jgi:acylphosphatase
MPCSATLAIVIRRRAIVHGRVQGVFFRDTTRRQAAARSVAGWVRNCLDGTVDAVFEGDPEAVEALLTFCREGPRGAVVERVEVFDEEPEGLTSFEIR